MYDCLKTFRKEIVWGAIYPCVSCHRACFRNGVNIFKVAKVESFSKLEEMIDAKLLNAESQLYVKSSFWICHTCKSWEEKQNAQNIHNECITNI